MKSKLRGIIIGIGIGSHYKTIRMIGLIGASAIACPTLAAGPPSNPEMIEVARSPNGTWVPKPVRTLANLPTIAADLPAGKFGGIGPADPTRAKGYFKTALINDRWWLMDPEGRRFIHQGVASVRFVSSKGAQSTLVEQFGSSDGWGRETASLLRAHGFNGLGAWSDDATLRPASSRLVYTKLWNFMSAYGKARGGTYQKPGHTGYPADCPFIFDPEFPAFCDEYARQLAATKDDPWLLGHFTDNELPWNIKMLDRYLTLPATDPGFLAASRWLRQRHGTGDAKAATITSADRGNFLMHAADTYFSAVCSAIRKHDPNHLILGARFHGSTFKNPELLRAAGRHLDVVSINYYHAWTPDPQLLATWSRESGKPFIITEWYAKGADSGLANTSGAGWLVKTQRERGLYYQNFTLGLLESKACVGWHWFKYADNDPDDKRSDPSNRDSNKGIVSNRYAPYQPLLAAMKEINCRSHGLIRYFEGLAKPAH